jgi:hypothetical protein
MDLLLGIVVAISIMYFSGLGISYSQRKREEKQRGGSCARASVSEANTTSKKEIKN